VGTAVESRTTSDWRSALAEMSFLVRPSFAIAVSFAAESRKKETIVATTSSYFCDAFNGAPNS
jgi:hypothetical protein